MGFSESKMPMVDETIKRAFLTVAQAVDGWKKKKTLS